MTATLLAMTLATSFVFGGPPVSVHFSSTRPAISVPRIARPPIAFEGIESLSDEQLQSLLSQLKNAGLKQSEQERVDVFERASPSVAYIQTSIVQRTQFSRAANEYPAGAGSGDRV